MASTNVYRNILAGTLIFTPDGGAPLTALSSVIDLAIQDASTFEEDGSDSDVAPTFVDVSQLKGQGAIGFRDANQAATIRGRVGSMTWTEKAAKGTNINMKALAVAIGQPGSTGQWSQLRGYPVQFRCGAFGKASDIS
jgi:hypothetical protein